MTVAEILLMVIGLFAKMWLLIILGLAAGTAYYLIRTAREARLADDVPRVVEEPKNRWVA